MSIARILTIAGSDSGGGAGIQADIKTITALGGYATSAITALTAQNTTGVQAIEPTPATLVARQIRSVLEDIGADAIKTGMLHNSRTIRQVAKLVAHYPHIPLVVDPIMVAKGGEPLLEQEAIAALRDELLPRATLVTPNIPEAEILASCLISGREGMISAGRRILKKTGCQAVLVKGGHARGDQVIDILVTAKDCHSYEAPRRTTRHTHGTGCTLSAAIATTLAQGYPLRRAVEKAHAYLQQAIAHAPGLGQGHGPLGHGWPLIQEQENVLTG